MAVNGLNADLCIHCNATSSSQRATLSQYSTGRFFSFCWCPEYEWSGFDPVRASAVELRLFSRRVPLSVPTGDRQRHRLIRDDSLNHWFRAENGTYRLHQCVWRSQFIAKPPVPRLPPNRRSVESGPVFSRRARLALDHRRGRLALLPDLCNRRRRVPWPSEIVEEELILSFWPLWVDMGYSPY